MINKELKTLASICVTLSFKINSSSSPVSCPSFSDTSPSDASEPSGSGEPGAVMGTDVAGLTTVDISVWLEPEESFDDQQRLGDSFDPVLSSLIMTCGGSSSNWGLGFTRVLSGTSVC